MIKNTNTNYGSIAKALHWLMSIIIICMLVVGFIISDMPSSPEKMTILRIHQFIGVTVLLLVSVRLCWKLFNTSVEMPQMLSTLHKRVAKIFHIALYCMMFTMPISGVLMSLNGGYDIDMFLFNIHSSYKNAQLSGLFYTIHYYGAFVLATMVILHFLAGMYHHFILKNTVLLRMLKNIN